MSLGSTRQNYVIQAIGVIEFDMKILVVGDIHAEHTCVPVIAKAADAIGAEFVWQVGDLGYWPRFNDGMQFLYRLSNEIDVPIYFADGNHEDHSMLKHDEPEPYKVYKEIYHVPRGVVVVFDGLDVMFFGGAHSVDRQWRTEGRTWFPNETPSRQEWRRARDAGKVNIVIAHDAPSFVDYGYSSWDKSPWPERDLALSERFRQRLRVELLEIAQPILWFNGHHHKRVTTLHGDVTVETLGDSTQPAYQFMVELDTDTMEVKPVMIE